MRHLLRYVLRGSVAGLCGLAIAGCAGLADLPDIVDVKAPSSEAAASSEIAGIDAVRMRVARKAMESEHYDVAARFYQAVRDAVPGSIEPLLGLGEVGLARGELDDAEAAYRAALRLSPEAAEANDGLGRVLVSQGAFLEAIQYFRRALARAPSAGLHNRLGVAHDLMGDGEAAQRHYRAALALDPNIVTARNNLALSLAISEQFPEAIAEMERVAAMPGATDRHRQNLAFVYGMAGRLDDTQRVLGRKDVPKSEQERDRALFERIRALAKAGDRTAILAFLRSARPGASFADQMDSLPPAPETAVAAVAPQAPPRERGLRPDEMAVPAPGTTARDDVAAIPAEPPLPAPAPQSDTEGMARLSEPTAPAATPSEPAAAIEAAAAGMAADGPYRVQLASYRTEATAMRGHTILLTLLGKRIPGLEVLVRQPRSAEATAIDYRLRTPPLADRDAGAHLCAEIMVAGHADCLVIRHNPARWQEIARPSAVAGSEAGQYRVQLASYRSQRTAMRGRDLLSKMLGEHATGMEILVKRAHTDGSRAIDFAIRSAPLAGPEEGQRLCDAVRAAGHPGCLVIRHSDAVWQIAAQEPAGRPAAAPTEAAKAPQDGQYRVQLASYRSERRALRGRAILSKLLGDQFSALEVLVKRSHAEGMKSADYTIRSMPVKGPEEGDRLCAAVIAAGHTDCLVIEHNAAIWQLAAQQPDGPAAPPQGIPDAAAEPASPAAAPDPAAADPMQPGVPEPAAPK